MSVGKPYRMVNETTAEVTEGCTIWYIMRDGFPSIPLRDEDGGLGIVPAKASMPPQFYFSAKECGIPCVADCEFTMRVKGGGVTLKPLAITLPNSALSQVIDDEVKEAIDAAEAAAKGAASKKAK